MTPRRLGLALAVVAALGAVALIARGRDPASETLHVRVTMNRSQDHRAGEGGMRGASRTKRSEAIALAVEMPVLAPNSGAAWRLAPDPARDAALSGQASLQEESSWYNFEASSATHIAMNGRWSQGTAAATAPVASAPSAVDVPGTRADVEPLDPSDPRRGLRATLGFELPLRGEAHDSRFQYAERRAGVPGSPWPGCTLTATTASCRLALRVSTLPPSPPASSASAAGSDASVDTPAPSWDIELRGMTVTWDRDGRFVARADSPREHPDTEPELHVVLWTSARGDATPPPGVPR